jgi:hypothetical protein
MKRLGRGELQLFGTSFLDCICCGFGAVILLFMLTQSRQREDRERKTVPERQEVTARQVEVVMARRRLEELRVRQSEVGSQQARALARAEELQQEAGRLEVAEAAAQLSAASSNQLAQIQAELASKTGELERKQKEGRASGHNRARIARPGDGIRQVLTGMRTDGRRVLFLVEASGGMLDAVPARALELVAAGEAGKRQSRKWRQAMEAVRWLAGGLDEETVQVQIATINTEWRLLGGDGKEWVPVNEVNRLVGALENVVPAHGCDLGLAFTSLAAMGEPPDLVYLFTDGMPTVSSRFPAGTRLDDRMRLQLFDEACQMLPQGLPLNIFLLPLEGDPNAAPALWNLAFRSGGSLQIPPENWP